MIEHRLVINVMKKALREGNVSIKLKTRAEAIQLRIAFYNILAPYKNAEVFDEEVLRATQELQLSVKENVLVIEQKPLLKFAGVLADTLGTTPEAVEQEMLRELEKEVQGVEDPGAEARPSFDVLLEQLRNSNNANRKA